MPDLKDELDALFDDGEKSQEEENGKEAEERCEDGKPKAKKSKLARAEALAASRKTPGRSAAGARAKSADADDEATHHRVRPAAPPTQARSQGSSLKLVLGVSLVLNIVILVFIVALMGKLNALQGQIVEVKNEAVTATNVSRAQLHFYTERGGAERALFVLMPRDVTEFPSGCKSYDVPRQDLGTVVKK